MTHDMRSHTMPPHVRRFLVEQTVMAFVVNAVINGVAPWFFFRYQGMDVVPLFGPLSVAGDTLGTAFILTFLVAAGIVLTTYHQMNRGRLPGSSGRQVPLGRAVSTSIKRALLVAIAATVLVPPIIIGPLMLAGLTTVDLPTFCLVKALVAGAYAAVLAPALALHTLRKP